MQSLQYQVSVDARKNQPRVWGLSGDIKSCCLRAKKEQGLIEVCFRFYKYYRLTRVFYGNLIYYLNLNQLNLVQCLKFGSLTCHSQRTNDESALDFFHEFLFSKCKQTFDSTADTEQTELRPNGQRQEFLSFNAYLRKKNKNFSVSCSEYFI